MMTKINAGIYLIESPSGAIYIGQSRNLRKRFISYKNLLCKDQPAIYNSLKKYGPDKHIFQIVHYLSLNSPQNIINYYEVEYMALFKKNGFRMLNIKEGGSNGKMAEETKMKLSELKKGIPRDYFRGELNPYYGKKHTDEIRKRMSDSNKGKKTGSDNGRARCIIQYDLHNNKVKIWPTIKLASDTLKISRQSINSAVMGRNKTAHGFIWKYKEQAA